MIYGVINLSYKPCDDFFKVNGEYHLCHATRRKVLIDGIWKLEYIDRNGNFHYSGEN